MTTRVRRVSPQARGIQVSLLGIYLNDHLAGATVGTRRSGYMARSARSHGDSPLAEALAPIADEIAEDRESLLGIMRRLDVPTRRYKVWAAGAAEWLGRLKSNGRLVRRSPLTSVVELEFLRLGVEGKAAVWGAMRPLADADERLDEAELDELAGRARRQLRVLEELRLRQAQEVFRDGGGEHRHRSGSADSPRSPGSPGSSGSPGSPR